MKKVTKKRLVNHKLYCGKYYARIGGQFKEIDISSRDIARLNSASPIDDTLDFEKPFIFKGAVWHTKELKITHRNAYQFPSLEIEAVSTEGY